MKRNARKKPVIMQPMVAFCMFSSVTRFPRRARFLVSLRLIYIDGDE